MKRPPDGKGVREAGRRPHKLHIPCFRPRPKSAVIPLLVLSPTEPLCWVPSGAPIMASSRQHLTNQKEKTSRWDVFQTVDKVPYALQKRCIGDKIMVK